MREAMAWLDAREPIPPVALRARMDQAIRQAFEQGRVSSEDGITSTLGEAALIAMELSLKHCEERAGALDLLTADALLTYAMEAASEIGDDAVDAVADAYGGARLAGLLADDLNTTAGNE